MERAVEQPLQRVPEQVAVGEEVGEVGEGEAEVVGAALGRGQLE